MLEHTRKHPTDKQAIKNQLAQDVSDLEQCLTLDRDQEDVEFLKRIQQKLNDLLPEEEEDSSIPASEVFKELTKRHTKAGALLKGLRVREGLGQVEFAKMIGTSQANLSAMENGRRSIGKAKAKVIAEKFNTDYRYFL